MTRSAKLDDPSIPLDSANPRLGADPQHLQADWAHSGRAPEIEDDLVTELESALQAVLERVPRPDRGSAQGPVASLPTAPSTRDRDQGPDRDLYISDAQKLSPDANAQPLRLSYPPLRSANGARPTRALSWELDSPAEDHWRPADQARRWIAPRAALCVAGLLGLAATAAVALTSFGDSGEVRVISTSGGELKSKESVAAVATYPSSATYAAAQGTEGATGEAEAPGERMEVAATPPAKAGADAVTLLRPVGETSAAPASLSPAPEASDRQNEVSTEPMNAEQESKTVDRLVEFPAPGEERTPLGAQSAGSDQAAHAVPAPAGGPPAAANAPFSFDAGTATAGGASPSPDSELVAAAEPRSGAVLAPGGGSQAGASSALNPASSEAVGNDAQTRSDPAELVSVESKATRAAPVKSAVNMRAGPDNGAAVLTIIPAGSEVGVIGCDYWCEVVFAGERGWIYKSFIRGADS